MTRQFGWLANHPVSVAAPSCARRIVDLFGGLTRLSSALGHRNPTTVQGWLVRGVVPVRQIPKVIAVGRKLGLELSLDDFFDAPKKAA